jgi:hypothetical protein
MLITAGAPWWLTPIILATQEAEISQSFFRFTEFRTSGDPPITSECVTPPLFIYLFIWYWGLNPGPIP